jgi:hypothetical protein
MYHDKTNYMRRLKIFQTICRRSVGHDIGFYLPQLLNRQNKIKIESGFGVINLFAVYRQQTSYRTKERNGCKANP